MKEKVKCVKERRNGTAPIKMGLIIDPGYYDFTVDVATFDTVLKIIKG